MGSDGAQRVRGMVNWPVVVLLTASWRFNLVPSIPGSPVGVQNLLPCASVPGHEWMIEER
jgi:hypothetical protein